MNSQAVRSDLVLTRRLADGTTELIPIGVAHQETALAGAEYSLIDRSAGFQAPSQLVAQREGADLILLIDGAQALVIDGFFVAQDVTFYPAPDLIGGTGPFSGERLTPESPALAQSSGESAGEVQTIWSAEPLASLERGSETPRKPNDDDQDGGISPLVWVGVGVGALAAAAGGGGGGGGGGAAPVAAGSGGTADTDPPQISSGSTADSIEENSGAGKVVYIATASDAGTITWSLSGIDSAAFAIDPDSGVVTLIDNPDFETQPDYAFTVIATDGAGNSSEQDLVLSITDQDDVAPFITSGASAGNTDENSGADQVVYVAAADSAVSWSLAVGEDSNAFAIDAQTGAVTFLVDPDFETQPEYAFTVIATDEADNESEQRVVLSIDNLDEVAPTITSGGTAPAIDENSGAGQVVYTVTSTDNGDISGGSTSYSLDNGGDADAFDIDPDSGAVTLIDNPDFETQASYTFTVVATDAAGNSSSQAVVLSIADQDDVAPFITSGASAGNIDENSGADQVVYVAAADGAVSWSLAAGDDSDAFTIDAQTGAVTLPVDPDFETQASYTFTVVARNGSGLESEQAVTLNIGNLDEVAPTITSGGTAPAIDENSGADQVVYTVTSTDAGDISSGSTSYSLGNGGDADAFDIDPASGAVTLSINPDFETQPEYAFTVIATDEADNESEQRVVLSIDNLDEVAPTITSGGTAPAIDENSGAGQVVYTVTSTDNGDISSGSTSYSLDNGGDADAFDIDPDSGVVTLIDNPDFETQASYTFTVVATDAAGNSSERGLSLAINDIDETVPAVVRVALTEAVGTQNGILNSGDTVRVTVSMSTDIVVDTAGGTPRIALDIGGDTAFADFVSGDGTSSLVFEYVIQAGDNDANGIRIRSDSIQANGGTLTNAIGTPANLEHGNVRNNPDFVVDTQAPNLTSSNPDDDDDDVALDADIELQFGEDIAIGSGNIVISNGTDTRTIDVTDASQVRLDQDEIIIDLANDLNPSSNYSVQVESGAVTDEAGNAFAGISDTTTLNFGTENPPVILSGPTAAEIAENSGQDQVIYTAIADVDVTWRLEPSGDADALSIDALSGAVTLDDNPDFEAQSNYVFTVVARNDSGLESEQAVTLNIGNLDEVAPTITSGESAPAIDENSGAGQVVYTVTSTDDGDISSGSTSYSLGNGGDADAFDIDPDSGVVTLIDNPDFETQASYTFTVVATDAAGNSSERGLSLAINDIDETVPAVVRVALTEAVGTQNGILNSGDTVRVTVSMSTDIVVDTAGGTPRIALDIGGDTAFADFVSGGGTSSLVFEYVIQAGDNDADGIRIRSDSIQANGGTLASATGIPADLEHGNVRNNPDFIVDTQAPSFSSSTPDDDDDDVALDADIELQFSENLAIGSGNIVISDGTDTRTIDVTDATQVSLDQDRIIIDLANDLNPSSNYSVQVESGAVTDEAGNAFAGISDTTTLNFGTEAAPVDTTIVVFDLVQGTSSNHSGRSFSSGVSYDIYIRVDSNDSALSTAGDGPGSWGRWDDVDNLGSDDRIILVGNGGPVEGRFANPVQQISFAADFIAWESGGANGLDAARIEGSSFVRITGGFFPDADNERLFDSSLGDDFFAIQNGNLSTRYLTSMPAGVLTSQGLV